MGILNAARVPFVRNGQKQLGLIIILFSVISLSSGCNNSSDKAPTAQNKEKTVQEITIAYGLDTDAQSVRNSGDMLLKIFTTERLVELEGTKVVPGLAESWDIRKNGETIIFNLRKGLSFSDGSPFNANAVKFTFERLMAFNSSAWTEIDRINHLEIIDPYTIAVHYKDGMSGYIALTAFAEYGCSILSPNSVKPEGNPRAAIVSLSGTGPWMIVDYQENQYTVFVHNPHYHGVRPVLDKITIKTIPKAEARVLAIQSGGVDVVVDYCHGGSAYTPRNMLKSLKEQGFKILKKEMPMTTYLVFNYKKAPWNDVQVRKAFNHAINKDDIAALFDGWINTAKTALFADMAPYISDAGTAVIPFNRQKAKQLLLDTGFPLHGSINLIAQGQNPDEVKLCEVIKAQLMEVGVDVQLDVLESGGYLERTKNGKYDLRIYYVGGPERRIFTRMDGRFNPDASEFGEYGFFAAQEITAVLKKAVSSFDEEERKINFHQFYEIVNELAAGVPLYFNAVFVVCKPEIEGIKFISSEPRFDSVQLESNRRHE
ncbi:MAG: ABC transporter substrate-binding protein [Pseudomonadota bacterium]